MLRIKSPLVSVGLLSTFIAFPGHVHLLNFGGEGWGCEYLSHY